MSLFVPSNFSYNDNNNYLDKDVLNEVYFGRTPSIERIISQIGLIRSKAGVRYNPNAIISTKYNASINTFEEMLELNRMLEEEFGFKTCSVSVLNESGLNAFTIPIDFTLNSKKPADLVIATKTGFKYKPEANYSLLVYITSGLMLDNRFSDAEVTAVLFHEIGHNFSCALSNSLAGLVQARMIITTLSNIIESIEAFLIAGNIAPAVQTISNILATNNAYRNFINNINNNLRKNKVYNAFLIVSESFNIVTKVIIKTMDDIKTAIALLTGNVLRILFNVTIRTITNIPFSALRTLLGGYRDEQFADSFPGLYGLGPEQASSLEKFGKGSGSLGQNIIMDTPFIGHLYSIITMPSYILQSVFECHPSVPARVKEEIDLLKNELDKNNLDPKLKKDLKNQIQRMEDDFDKTIRVKNSLEESFDPHILQRLYDTWLYDKNGGDLRSKMYDNKKICDTIDLAYTDHFVKSEKKNNKK